MKWRNRPRSVNVEERGYADMPPAWTLLDGAGYHDAWRQQPDGSFGSTYPGQWTHLNRNRTRLTPRLRYSPDAMFDVPGGPPIDTSRPAWQMHAGETMPLGNETALPPPSVGQDGLRGRNVMGPSNRGSGRVRRALQRAMR